jgi:hypothetical protein
MLGETDTIMSPFCSEETVIFRARFPGTIFGVALVSMPSAVLTVINILLLKSQITNLLYTKNQYINKQTVK